MGRGWRGTTRCRRSCLGACNPSIPEQARLHRSPLDLPAIESGNHVMGNLAVHGHIGCELVDVDLAHLLAGVAEPLKIDERHRRKRKFVEGLGREAEGAVMAAFWFWRSQDRGAARWSLRKNRGLLGHCRHVREDGQRGVDAMDGTRSDMGAAGDGVGVVQTHHGRRSAPGMP